MAVPRGPPSVPGCESSSGPARGEKGPVREAIDGEPQRFRQGTGGGDLPGQRTSRRRAGQDVAGAPL
jgi:hypothetical protein